MYMLLVILSDFLMILCGDRLVFLMSVWVVVCVYVLFELIV